MEKNQYFGTAGTDEIGHEITKRVDAYDNFVNANGLFTLWQRSFKQYYSGYYYGGELKSVGEQGELLRGSVNHYRNILQHILTMATQQRINYEPKAINTDYKSISQTILAKNLLEYYMRTEHIEKYMIEAAENALVFGEGYVYSEWDFAAGETIFKTEKKINEFGEEVEEDVEIKTGDISFRSYHPRDVVRDTNTAGKKLWYILVTKENKYELAAKYKNFADKILNATDEDKERFLSDFSGLRGGDAESDNVNFYRFIHRVSSTLPKGRLVECLDDGTVLFDGDLPYKQFPLYAIIPSKMKDTDCGYTIAFDLLPQQVAFDGLFSSVVTNQDAFGVQNVLVPNGSDVSVSQLSSGMNFIYYNSTAGKPEPLQLLKTPPELFSFMQQIESHMQTTSGVNSVARGNPEASLKSGAALALVQSMAIQFNSLFQNAYSFFAEELGSGIVSTLQKYAKAPRVAIISGKTNRSYMQEFTGDDIANITRVIVDLGSPLMRTTAGRLQVADTLLERGKLATPEEYMQIIDSGKLEPLIEGDRNEIMLIRSENEKMMGGEMVDAIAVDNHTLHIKEHKSVLSSTELRMNPDVVSMTLAHIEQHIDLMRTTDPDLLSLTGTQPLAPVMPPADAGGMPMIPEEEMPNMPNMPTNPLTGEQAPSPMV